MVKVACPVRGCAYETPDLDASVVSSLLNLHNNEHLSSPSVENTSAKQKPPKLERPVIEKDSSEETWNVFQTRWKMFKEGTEMTSNDAVRQLFSCCGGELGDEILRGHPLAVSGTVEELMKVIKKLAVIPVAISVRRSELISSKQDHGEGIRSFHAKLKGKAATCGYTVKCADDNCNQVTNFTDVIVKDVVMAGLVDVDIKKDVLGWAEIDEKSVDEVVTFIEAKEMARDALAKHTEIAAVSSYRSNTKVSSSSKKEGEKTSCKNCGAVMDKFIWNRRSSRMVECTLCASCWRKSKKRGNNSAKDDASNRKGKEDVNAIMIGAVELELPSQPDHVQKLEVAASAKEVVLDHHIFDSDRGWQKSESTSHPTLHLGVSTCDSDYSQLGRKAPQIHARVITAVSDTGAQSCLWGTEDFLRCGFKKSDLIPVKRLMYAANRKQINIDGAIFIRLSGIDSQGKSITAPVMAYVSPDTKKFYLSRDALVQLSVIPSDFPKVGAALETSTLDSERSACGCLTRSLPPPRPDELPFECVPENNNKMREWLLERFAGSTFNRCPHQLLQGMTGPEIAIHVDPKAKPVAVKTPAMVPGHWQDEVKSALYRDVDLGVLEVPPMGEPDTWVHRMVLTQKDDGTVRRVVDLSPLNKHCSRETHHVQPPFQQARNIPPNTWKTVTDAWNGYHSVPIREEDRHLTTFITPWGRFRYRMAPQGFLASGDGYTRRFDEIIIDVPRKTKCVDDTVIWDDDLAGHWWRVIDFLHLLGHNGIVLNSEKFQFCKREITFAGFKISDSEIKPHDKHLKAIRDFPTPTKVTDIRSWFGLVHQVANYAQLSDIMAPFKPLLSPKVKFSWSDELNAAFIKSKIAIVNAIKEGVEIFDFSKPTCLRPDWSKTGIGFFLSQKHCICPSALPGCCSEGWKVTMAGSRFLKPSETRYAAVEGEALAIQWSLEQTRYFTLGCENLVIITDHKPLVKLFGDRTLDEITNTRLFRLKQKTLMWKFLVVHMPGKNNAGADAMSRHPVDEDAGVHDDLLISNAEILAGLRSDVLSIDNERVEAITWKRVQDETQNDMSLRRLREMVLSSFPKEKHEMPPDLVEYWLFKDDLYVVDGVILKESQVILPENLRHQALMHENDHLRVIIPQNLRSDVLQSLHAAHQGVSAMNERAKISVFWPGITKDIINTRYSCSSCNNIAPSQAKTPPIVPMIPTTPFEAVVSDYFHFRGYYYLVYADRLSGWTEQVKIKVGTNEAGAGGLCKALRQLFATFGVPAEISSDGGPEFVAKETTEFFKRWGIHHRLSSVSFPSSNGRAELAVKATKRLLMDNVGPNGELNTERMVQALLMQRNTPDPGCHLSPAQVLFGRPLRDTLPFIQKNIVSFSNPQLSSQWRHAWNLKEEAMRTRYVKTLEDLGEHSKSLPHLAVGDHVFVQNQSGRFPKRWDKSGVVCEVKENDQYTVRISGTGRLTLRNRRFLRKFTPHWLSNSPGEVSQSTKKRVLKSPEPYAFSPAAHDVPQHLSNPMPEASEEQEVMPEVLDGCVTKPVAEFETPEKSDTMVKQSKCKRMLTELFDYNKPGNVDLADTASAVKENNSDKGLRRSTRIKRTTKNYDAATGE